MTRPVSRRVLRLVRRAEAGAHAPASDRGAGWQSRARTLAIALGVTAVLAIAPMLAGVALAHANLVRAVPAPGSAAPQSPPRVEAWFSEPMSSGLSSLTVFDTAGARVDAGDSAVDPADRTHMTVSLSALSDGTYTVFWRNVSDVDGHPLSGTFVFYVGAKPADAPATATVQSPPSLVSPAEPFARWGVLVGLLAAFGTLLFEFAVLAPAMRGNAGEDVRAALSGAHGALARMRLAALALLVAASVAHLAVQAAASTGVSLSEAIGTPMVRTLDSQWGRMWVARLALVWLAAGFLLLAPRVERAATLLRAAALITLGGAGATIAFSSHAAADRLLAPPALANELLHLLAAGAWGGGLVAFALVAWRARRDAIEPRRRTLAAIASRFSPLAFLATGVLAVTGAYGAWIEVARVSALGTPYGVAVIAKVVTFLGLIALGAVNLRWVAPRLRQSGRAARVLTRTVPVEVGLVAAALLAAGFLASLQPAKQAEAVLAAGPRSEQTSEGVRIRIAVDPGRVGTNRVAVDLARADGTPLTSATHVGIRVQFADADIGAVDLTAREAGPGRYVADAAVLSLRGNWQAEVVVSRSDGFDARSAFRFPVTPAAGADGAVTSVPARQIALLAFGWEIVVLGLLLLGVSAVWWSRMRVGRIADWAGAAVAISGILMVYGVGHVDAGQPPPSAADLASLGAANPIAADAASVALGRDLFAQRCVTCHGPTGLGDGPAARALVPPPADLRTHVPLHTDGVLFGFISSGFPGSAMPAFKGELTDEQMWHLVNYLRTLK